MQNQARWQKEGTGILQSRQSISTLIKLAYVAMFIVNAFSPLLYLQYALGLSSLLLFVLSFSETRSTTRLMSIILIAVGAYFMLTSQVPPHGWIRACIYNTPLIALLLTVPLLGSILYFEPYQQHFSTLLSRFVSSPYRFYAVTSTMLTLLAALINLASFHFVHQLLRPTAEKYPAKLFHTALIRGFMPNTTWSPSYISVAFATQYANISWFTIAPIGITLALAGSVSLLLVGYWEYGQLENPISKDVAPVSPSEVRESARIMFTLLFQTGILIFLIVALEYFTQKSAMVIVPVVAFAGPLMLALAYGRTGAYLAQVRDFFTCRLPQMNNEVVLFTSIGFFGYALGISDIPSYIPILINRLGLDTPATLAPLLVFAIGLLSMIGIHPLITIAALAASLPPGSSPLSTIQLAASFLAGYTLYSVLSPFSAVNLMVSSLSKQSPLAIGLQQNGGFAVINALVSILIILMFF